MNFTNTIKTMFGYDAVVDKGRRRAPRQRIRQESLVLNRRDREKLVATIKDMVRNDPTVAWAFRKHLDYTSTFTFQSKTGNKDLDKEIEKRWADWSKKENCDIAKRHSMDAMIRLYESGKILDGDCALLKIKGFKLQGVESDRIGRSKSGLPPVYEKTANKEGLVLDENGAVMHYIVNSRDDNGGLIFQKAVKPDNIIFDGYFTRFDQTRGISPVAGAVNTFIDVNECNQALLLKCKKHGMFGLAITSDSTGRSGFNEVDANTGEDPDVDTDKYDFQMDMGMKLELDQGDGIEMFESKTPSNEYQDYVNLMLRIALLSFDIPYTFFNSQGSSYSAAKQDRAEYEISSKNKRQSNKDAYNTIAEWVLPEITKDLNIDDLQWEFIPQGTPWIDELKEIQATAMRISTGVSSRSEECKKKGKDFSDVILQLGKEETQIKENKASITIGQPGQQLIGDDEGEEV